MKSKKLLAMVLCAMMTAAVFAGCGEKTNESSTTTDSSTTTSTTSTTTETGNPTEIRITRCLYFGDVSEYQDLKEEWPKYIEEKYGYKVTVNSLARNEYMQKLNLMITGKEVDGIVNAFTTADVWSYRDQGVIDAVDGYLANNANWNNLVPEQRDMFNDGEATWAINTGYARSMFVRVVRKDWLDKLGLEVPKTVDELYEVARAFTYDDPDGNGIQDTYGLTAAGTWNLGDIFQAFDARLNPTSSLGITYDPNEEQWIESMLKPEMVDCLTYLNKMYTEGILDPELFTNAGSNMRDNMYSGKAGSTFYWAGTARSNEAMMEANFPDVDWTEVSYLTGNLTKNVNHVSRGGSIYVMLSGTEDAEAMTNAFVDLLFGSEEQFLDCMYGIEGKNYTIDGNKIYSLVDESTGTAIPNTGFVSWIPAYEGKYVGLTEGMTAEQEEEAIAAAEEQNAMYDEGLADGGLYNMKLVWDSPISDTFNLISGDLTTAFETAVSGAITGSVPVEQAIQNYLTEAKNLGAQAVLDEANASIGVTDGSYKY